MKKILLFQTLILCFTAIHAQSSFISTTISNNTTGLPIVSYPDLFYSQFHPGLEISYGKQLNKNQNNKLILKGNIGFYYHQFVQSLLKIYPTLNYERKVNDRLLVNAGLGGGYGLSFEGKNAFKLLEDGTYENKSFLGARSQYLLAFEIGASYLLFEDRLASPLLEIQLKSFMQGTYVKSYVPLLPLNAINIGIRIPLKTSE